MKLELWEQDMIFFMRNASEYGDYNRRLTEKMLPWLSADMHICDAGSGLGYLSLTLAPFRESHCRGAKSRCSCGFIGELPKTRYFQCNIPLW